MKLHKLYSSSDEELFLEYKSKLKPSYDKILDESKITITIDDTSKVAISQENKAKFIDKAQELGNFSDSDWVSKLVNGMKQAGIHGLNEVCEDDAPASQADIKKLINMLIELIN